MKAKAFTYASILCAASLFIGLALGQTPATAPAPAPAPAPEPVCWPSNVGGTGTAVVNGVLPNPPGGGSWTGWWCPDGNGDWIMVATWSRNARVTQHPLTITGTPVEIARQYWGLNAREPSNDTERAQLAAAQAQVSATKPAVTMAWQVAPEAADGKEVRPTYLPWREFLLEVPLKVNAGWFCDCTAIKIEREGATYCAIRASVYPETVAACTFAPIPPIPPETSLAVGKARGTESIDPGVPQLRPDPGVDDPLRDSASKNQ